MVQGRPIAQKRFAGGNAQDLESFMTQFEKVTDREGVTDDMKFIELKHWTTGSASIVVSQYENEKDSTEALTKAKAHLKKEFGRKLVTARQMLDELLTGPEFKKQDSSAIQVFLLRLSQVHKRAMETQREGTFSTRETFEEIIRKQLPFFSRKLATRLTDIEEKIAETQNYSHQMSFSGFLDFCRRENNINVNDQAIWKKDSSSSASSSGKPNNGKTTKKIAATEVDVAATTTSKPKTNKKPSAPMKKAPTNVAQSTSNQTVATKPAVTASKTGDKTCLACNHASHSLDSCREFLKMNDEDKRLFVKKKGVCYLCLEHGHMASNCPCDIRCNECNGKHNTVFHREKQSEPEESHQS